MISNRSYYTPELELCRRNERGMTFPLANGARVSDRYDTVDCSDNRRSPASDTESKSGGPPRKRVPVACKRCRKRKIKCSGDEGLGRGCSNCRNANSTQECQFLRVQSSPLEMSHPGIRPWQGGTHYGYGSHVSSRFAPYPMAQGCSASGGYVSAQPTYDCGPYLGAAQQNFAVMRSQNGGSAAFSYEEGYQNHSPAYLLPNADNTSSVNYFGPSSSPNPITPCLRSPSSVMYTEKSVNSPMISSVSQFVPSNLTQGTTLHELPTVFSGMMTSAASMPTADRTLPNPAQARSLSTAKTTSNENVPISSFVQRTSNTWNADAMSSGSQSSGPSVPSSVSGSQDGRSITSSSSQEFGFGYNHVSHSPQESTGSSSLSGAVTEAPQMSYEFNSSIISAQNSERCSTFSRDGIVSSNANGVDIYGYSSSCRSKRRCASHSTCSAQLANGPEYARLRSPQLRYNSEFSDVRHGPGEYTNVQSDDSHRTSITSLNNSTGF